MKRMSASFFAVIFAFVFAFGGCFSAFAKAEELKINSDVSVKVGDRVGYKLYLANCESPIIGFQMYLFYKSNNLKIVDGSMSFSEFGNVIYNTKVDDIIPMSWTELEGVNFAEKKEFLSVEFDVVKGGESEISQIVSELYGDDMTSFKNYTFTYDLLVNGTKIAENKKIIVNSDKGNLSKYQGGFLNYDDGMGENSPSSNSHKPVFVDSTAVSEVDFKNIAVISGFCLVAVAVVVVLIIRKRCSKNNAKGNKSKI